MLGPYLDSLSKIPPRLQGTQLTVTVYNFIVMLFSHTFSATFLIHVQVSNSERFDFILQNEATVC